MTIHSHWLMPELYKGAVPHRIRIYIFTEYLVLEISQECKHEF